MKVFGVVGWKDTGKTGLMERLVAEIVSRDLSVSTVKHAHHSFDIDRPGKDSYRHRASGATEVLLASARRWALMSELRDAPEPTLEMMLARLSPVDLVLVEGYKRDRHLKIETHRAEVGTPLIATDDPSVLAVASDTSHPGLNKPVFHIDAIDAIADFVLRSVGLRSAMASDR